MEHITKEYGMEVNFIKVSKDEYFPTYKLPASQLSNLTGYRFPESSVIILAYPYSSITN